MRAGGEVVGSCSAYAANVAMIGGRRFWVYRNVLDEMVAEQSSTMIRASFNVLAGEFDGSKGSPIGLCVLADGGLRRRHPEAEWSDPRMVYAGYLPEGHQVRIAYFAGAVIT